MIKNKIKYNNMECTNLTHEERIKLAIKYEIPKESWKTKKTLCKAIRKQYIKRNPCNLKISKETNMKIKKHQFNVANVLTEKRGLVLFHEVGTGKTLTAVVSSRCLLLSNIINKVIVITPTSLQENFKKELIKYDEDIDMTKYIFYTIQGLVYNIQHNIKIESVKNSLIIIDEAHNLRSNESVRFEEIFDYCKNAKKILLLTATPLINSKYDIINLISLIRNEIPITKTMFDEYEKNKNDLKQYVSNVFNIYTKPSEMYFPDKKIVEIFLKMDKKYLELYEKLENGEGNKFPQFNNKNISVFYNGVRRGSNIIDKKSLKVEWIINKILENKKSKFVIFSHFLNMGIFPIQNELDKHNIKYMTVSGEISIRERKNSVNLYNMGEINVLFITKSGAEGLDLKNTNFIIIMESSWNENEIIQIIGRGVRYKSHETTNKKLVIIYKLFLIKPDEYTNLINIKKHLLLDNGLNDNMLSVDLYMRNYSLLKQQQIENFYKTLQKLV